MSKINKAVIAAAGFGTRFLPVVKAFPKELIPVLNKPNIQYLVEEFIAAGVTDICIVHRLGNEAIKNYFTPNSDLEKFLKENNKEQYLESLKEIWSKAKLTFLPQPKNLPYGNASPLLAAQAFIGNDPFAFMFGDDLVLEEQTGYFVKHLVETFEKYHPGVVLGVQEVPWEEINRYASIKYKDHPQVPNQAEDVLEKLPKEEAPSNMAQFGRFVVDPKIFKVLEKQELSLTNELYFSDAVNTLAHTDIAIAEPLTRGKWLTTGDPLRWLKANIEYALKDPTLKEEITKLVQL